MKAAVHKYIYSGSFGNLKSNQKKISFLGEQLIPYQKSFFGEIKSSFLEPVVNIHNCFHPSFSGQE
jgi:hypothetical protein